MQRICLPALHSGSTPRWIRPISTGSGSTGKREATSPTTLQKFRPSVRSVTLSGPSSLTLVHVPMRKIDPANSENIARGGKEKAAVLVLRLEQAGDNQLSLVAGRRLIWAN